jgi:DNA-binding NarL/FixJ family response regulator
VVDPQADGRTLMCDLLRGAGHEPSQFASGREALEQARRHRPRLVVLEVELPDICGYHVCRILRDEYAESVAIVFVSGTRTESFDRVAGILLGADDYLSKPVSADEFLARTERLLLRPQVPNTTPGLTGREHDVLGLLAQGLRQKEIAQRLLISEKTVGTHMEHIFTKLGAHNRVQAIALAQRHHLVRSPG